MDLVTFYMLLFLFCGAVAWFFSGFASVRRLDERALALLRRWDHNWKPGRHNN